MTSDAAILRDALRAVAPGTPLREGLERIQRSHTGALIVLGYTPEVQALCSGGFDLDVAFTAARLRELCKMDGAVIIDPNQWRIRKANVQLFPDPTIPTDESGMRHRTAQRTARQTHLPVLSLSASMRMISIYVGSEHRLVEEPEALLSRATWRLTRSTATASASTRSCRPSQSWKCATARPCATSPPSCSAWR